MQKAVGVGNRTHVKWNGKSSSSGQKGRGLEASSVIEGRGERIKKIEVYVKRL